MTIPAKLPFDEVKKHALASYLPLLEKWLPGGKVVGGKEYVVLNPTRADTHIKSFSINIKTGQWGDFSTGDKGGDPISLYAYLKCGGTDRAHRVEACKLMAAEFGIAPGEAPPPRRKPDLKVVKSEPEEWQPIVPPPDDVPAPKLNYDHVFEYRDRDHRLLRYVVRNDANKWIRPLTYGLLKGKPGWELRGPNDPKSLYGLERLDGRPVALFEGEKKCDQVQALMPEIACLSLTGGTGQAALNDLRPLGGLAVLYVPDNDEAGRKAELLISAKLADLGCAVMGVDVYSHGFKEKWDLGNAVEEGWSHDRIRDFLRDNSHSFDPDPGNVDQDEYEQAPDNDWKEPPTRDKRSLPPVPLGYDRDIHYYLSPMKGQIVALTPSQHTAQNLTHMADLNGYWMGRDDLKNDKGKVNWIDAAAQLMSHCSDVGIFKPDLVRGRGAYMDEGRAVLNVGNRLIVDGDSLPLLLPGSRYFYEAALPLNYAEVPPLTKEQASEVMELCKLFSWEKPIYGVLMAGWLAVAPICGALNYRPAIWLTGGSGSGKSTLEKLIIQPALGGIGLFLKGGTTEAGVRQKLGRDARPLWIDEAESENPKSKGIMQGLLDLNRQSSSEGGAEIIKGTQSQTGAKTYHVKSCFGFSGINPMLDHLADESRISVLELTRHDAEARAGFTAFVERITRTMTDDFAAGFVARSVWLMPEILDNAKTFSKAVAVHLGNSRVGDQIGTLLAGAFSEMSDKRVSFEAALAWVKEQDWGDMTSADALTDERRLLNMLVQDRVTVDWGGTPPRREDLTVHEVIQIAAGSNGEAMAGVANKELRRRGLSVENGGLWVSNAHTFLKKQLKDTPWSSQWARTLRRLPGTKALGREEPGIKFAGELARATFVPLDLLG